MQQHVPHVPNDSHIPHIPFVGHQSELAYIDSVIQEWGTRRVICIDAPPSFGKTSLLHEIRRRHTIDHLQKMPLLVTDILDFNNLSLHKAQNIECRISHMVSGRVFDPFTRVLLNWRKMELAGAVEEELAHSSHAINQTFLDCCNIISARMVILADSVEMMNQDASFWFLDQVIKPIQNIVVLVAGRGAAHLGERLRGSFGEDAQTISLLPLSHQGAETYIDHKQHARQGFVPHDLARKIVLLSHGNPLYLDIATEMYLQKEDLAWLHDVSLQTLEDFSNEGEHPAQRQFERQLAHFLVSRKDHDPEKWLILLLSHIYPMDREMVAALFRVSQQTGDAFFHSIRSLPYVKTLPNDRICLHETVRSLIKTYIWPDIDLQQDEFRQSFRAAAVHVEQRVEALNRLIEELRDQERQAYERDDTEMACESFFMRSGFELEVQRLPVRHLGYSLLADTDEGLQTFVSRFDAATQAYRFRLRKMLLREMEEYARRISLADTYEMTIRRAEVALDNIDYKTVESLTNDILNREELRDGYPERRVETLNLRGNARARDGRFDEAKSDFERATEMAEEHGLVEWFFRARHSRGWVYFSQGSYEAAMEDYLAVYQHSLHIEDFDQAAYVLDNMSYVHVLRGKRQAALECSSAAWELRNEIGGLRGLAQVQTTFGEIYTRFNQPADALAAYAKALKIFDAEHDREWVSIVRCGRSYVLQQRGELDKAEEDLQWALEHGPTYLKPRIFYSQAIIHQSRGNIGQGCEKLRACRSISQAFGDTFHDYKSFADLVEMAWDCDGCSQWQEFREEHTRLYSHRTGADALRLRGSCLRKIGDLAICDGCYQEALQMYQEGLPIIAEYEIHGRYTIRSQLRQTDQRLRARVEPEVLRMLGRDLSQFWQERQELLTMYPEMLLIFHRWQKL
jgi:tetratricopeptide (TPR) repeat protein